jgi:integrase
MLLSVSDGTLDTYKRMWKQFSSWAKVTRNPFITIPVVCDYLVHMFKEGFKSNTLNVLRSAISFFSCNDGLNVGEHKLVSKLFRSFYRRRPNRPKYYTFWSVDKLLAYLKTLHPENELPLKLLTLKTLALIALSSSDRGQTLHSMNIDHIAFENNAVCFIIYDRLKTTPLRNPKPKIVRCIPSDIPEINVAQYARAYLEATSGYRDPNTNKSKTAIKNLFLSWKTKLPVKRNTLARWLKLVLSLAGINTAQFSAHSYRGAGLSKAYSCGATLQQIMEAGSWKNVETFQNHYNNPSEDSVVGQLILHGGARYVSFSIAFLLILLHWKLKY